MTGGRFGDPVADATKALAGCEAREHNLEGIETYLVVEDASGRPLVRRDDDEPDGAELALLAHRYLGQIAADPAQPTEAELGCTFEVLAAHHFEPCAERP